MSRTDITLAPVVQRLDNAIHRINRVQWISVKKTNHTIRWIVIYPVDSVIHLLNNTALNLKLRWLQNQARY